MVFFFFEFFYAPIKFANPPGGIPLFPLFLLIPLIPLFSKIPLQKMFSFFKQLLHWPMSQRRSCSSSSFGSAPRNSASNSSASSFASSSAASSKNASPSSSPHNSRNAIHENGRPKEKTVINICPFGQAPSTSNDSTAATMPSSTNSISPANDHLIPSPLPSPSKSNPKMRPPTTSSAFSLYCPLLCTSSSRQQSSKATSKSKNSANFANSPEFSKEIQQIFCTPKYAQNKEEISKSIPNGNSTNFCKTTNFCGAKNCGETFFKSTPPSAAAEKQKQQKEILWTQQRRRRRRNWGEKGGGNCDGKIGGKNANNGNGGGGGDGGGIWWRRNGKIREPLRILVLQFAWILPYLLFANYLERCLLPFRLHCYTDPDLLALRRSPRHSPEQCAAQFFASNGEFRSPRRRMGEEGASEEECAFNRTLTVLLEPWRVRMDDPGLRRVIVIRSAPRSLEYREFIRSSWKSAVQHSAGPVIFVTGQDGTELAGESAQHGDILQLDFADSYRNLSLKMMGIYRFFTERSQRIQQIVVINDDTIVNATALDRLFRSIENGSAHGGDDGGLRLPPDRRYLVGKVSRGYPRLVFPWLPWYVPAQLYPHKCYPPFVQGSSFVISREAAQEVLRRVCDFPWRHIHLDDILMGIATNCLGIANLHADGFDVGHGLDSFIVYHYQFSRHSADKLAGMFNSIRHLLLGPP